VSERFTEPAGEVVVVARDEAAGNGRPFGDARIRAGSRRPRWCTTSCSVFRAAPRRGSAAYDPAMPEQIAPKRFPDRDEIAVVRAEAEPLEAGGEAAATRRIAGRAMARRGMGKLVFVDVVDRSGRIQAICDVAVTGEVDVHLGDVVGVTGRAAKSRRGEPSVLAESVDVLARNTQPLPDTFHGLTDVELRYRKRYLDLLVNEETRDVFQVRARVITAVRRALDEDGFVEVETPILQPRYGGAFARPFVTRSNELDADLYLRIATELYLKRLIVGGLERVYEIGKDFRNEGVSFKHNPEFTMLEWYEAYADYRDTMDRIERLVEAVARDVLGATAVEFRGHTIELAGPWQRLRFVEALERHDLWTRSPEELRERLTERGVDTDADKDWAQLVDHAFSHFVEPGLIQPTIVHDYPVELSPFARPTDDDPTLTERFEYFAGGMELGNAFTEINDATMQQARFEQQSEQVEGERGDPDYVEALSYGMPPTGGLGFGIDRFVMLLTGKESIRDVVLFPALRSVQDAPPG
jgi:lysyl-tRNA synthetase class 2